MSQLISGYSRIDQILYFFEQHKTGHYTTLEITKYILNNFDFSNKKTPISGLTIAQQVHQEVYDKLAKLFRPEIYNITVQVNMNRYHDGKVIMYYYYPNKKVNLPSVEYVVNKQNLQEDPFTDSAVNEIVFKRVVDGKTITVTVTNN